MPTTIEVAAIKGLYRCSGDGQTKFLKKGESLGPCSCGEGEWLFLKYDNTKRNLLDVVYVNEPTYFILTDEVPEVGGKMNIYFPNHGGYYKITRVRVITGSHGKKFMIKVEEIGSLQQNLPVNCIAVCMP